MKKKNKFLLIKEKKFIYIIKFLFMYNYLK